MIKLPSITIKKGFLNSVFDWFVNSGLFYLGWILTLKFVLEGNYWIGPVINLFIIVLHIIRVPHRLFETMLILSLPILGSFLLDGSLVIFGILKYLGRFECCPWIPPVWILSLWGLFATSINHSLAWVDRKLWLTIATGAVGGTLSYYAAIRVGAAEFLVSNTAGIFLLAMAWGIVMPLCYLYNKWLKKNLFYRDGSLK